MSTERFPVPLAIVARRLHLSENTLRPGRRQELGLVDSLCPRNARAKTVWCSADSTDFAESCNNAIRAAAHGKKT